MWPSSQLAWSALLGAVLSPPIVLIASRLIRQNLSRRSAIIPPSQERVLILGASSGIGRSIAHVYAARCARVFIVGRREEQLEAVRAECLERSQSKLHDVLSLAGDFTDAQAMVLVRTIIEREWKGLDTLVVCAGVSALQPLMSVAGIEKKGRVYTPSQAGVAGIQNTVEVLSAALTGNLIGPLVSAVTFIPFLETTSPAPSILLMSSLASVIPAPTRSIYAASKGASLLLFQSLSIEHPSISFTHILPSTVQGAFRAGAVDSGPVREADPDGDGKATALSPVEVAVRSVRAVDAREKTVFMPAMMRLGHLLYWLWPSFIEKRARKKYNFMDE